ncbi:MAG: RNA polymerase-binding protein DksA [Dokdonella sp.]
MAKTNSKKTKAKSSAKPAAKAKPIAAKSSAGKASAGKSKPAAVKKPAAKKPVAKKPVAKKPPMKPARAAKPASKSAKRVSPATAKKATAKAPTVKTAKPTAKKVVPIKHAAKKPAAKKTVAKKPVAKKASAAKPVAKIAKQADKKMSAGKNKPTAPTPTEVPKTQVATKKTSADKAAKVVFSTKALPVKELIRSSVSTSNNILKASAKGAKVRAVRANADIAITMQDGRYALPATVSVPLPPGYKPSANEDFMSPRQLQYFRTKLQTWREELVEESKQTIENLRDEVRDVGDEAERATRETENSLELRTRDRYRKLISKIDKALKRIEEGHYGYCEETEEEIGLERLEARPIATLSLDAQERWEHRQKQMGD